MKIFCICCQMILKITSSTDIKKLLNSTLKWMLKLISLTKMQKNLNLCIQRNYQKERLLNEPELLKQFDFIKYMFRTIFI
ncbi:hypothetical protein pb186bvf_018666 [Paramecium bursaria]